MHLLLYLKYLGMALFSSSALAASIPQGISLTNGSLNAASNGAFLCSRRTSQTSVEPKFSDCAGVLRALPLNPTVGVFYNTGRGDFQLPHFETYRTCQVVIELQTSASKVQSSWLAVQVAALELNSVCQDLRSSPGLGSAYTYVDDSNLMKITLKGLPLGNGEGGTNATETS